MIQFRLGSIDPFPNLTNDHYSDMRTYGYVLDMLSFLMVHKKLLVSTAIPRDMLPLDMLTLQIRHYELRQKNSRYANFSDLSTPGYSVFDFSKENSRYALFTPSHAILK